MLSVCGLPLGCLGLQRLVDHVLALLERMECPSLRDRKSCTKTPLALGLMRRMTFMTLPMPTGMLNFRPRRFPEPTPWLRHHATKAAKSKWYAVAAGREPGVYTTWCVAFPARHRAVLSSSFPACCLVRDAAEQQINGYSGAMFKSFRSRYRHRTASCTDPGCADSPYIAGRTPRPS